MRKKLRFAGVGRRLRALLAAAGTVWALWVTAGSGSAAAAAEALWETFPVRALRWELGDLWTENGVSPAVAMTLREAPLLLAAQPAVTELWEQAETEDRFEELETVPVLPVEEAPVDAAAAETEDNGVPARTLVPTDPSGYTVCGSVYISNATDHALSSAELRQPFAAALSPQETDPQILIVHTHGSEAYTPTETESVVWSGDHRTTDSRYNVVKVGDEMAEEFGAAGIAVLHDRTLYDYPSYTGAYDRSLAAVQEYLTRYPSIRFVLDVHRDAVADAEGNQYKVLSNVEDGRAAAQLSLVVGSDGSGLSHPNWMENLRLATAVQERLLGEYPTLMRPVLLRNSRYNQHVTTGALLVEVGAAGNAPEEAALAGRLFARGMAEVLKARGQAEGA